MKSRTAATRSLAGQSLRTAIQFAQIGAGAEACGNGAVNDQRMRGERAIESVDELFQLLRVCEPISLQGVLWRASSTTPSAALQEIVAPSNFFMRLSRVHLANRLFQVPGDGVAAQFAVGGEQSIFDGEGLAVQIERANLFVVRLIGVHDRRWPTEFARVSMPSNASAVTIAAR